jgi:hypothetical protein
MTVASPTKEDFMLRMNPKALLKIVSVRSVASACLALSCLGFSMPAAWGTKKPSKPITTVDGRPIRKIYIYSASPDMTSSAANQLAQDTCLTTVTERKQADAVLNLGIALHAITNGLATPNVFGPSARPQTMGNANPSPQRSVSATCSDSKGGGCTGSYSAPTGDIAALPSGSWPGNAGGNLDVSLASPEKTSQELWEPNAHSKDYWSDQLRIDAGCPVCPDERFDRHKYKTYRNWIQDKCPTVLPQPEAQ